jgi:ABC-2 type transport system permease protein
VYAVLAKEPIGVIGAFLVSLLIPLLATALSSVCGYGVAVISKLFKKKTFVNVVLYLVFFAAYMVSYELVLDGFDKFLTDAENAGTVAYIPALYYIGAAALLEPLSFAIVAILSLAAAAVSYYVISKSYIRIVTSEYTPKVTYKEREARSRSQLSALIHKELSYFFSSTTYILNGGIGYLFAVALGVLFLVNSDLIGVFATVLFSESADPTSNMIPILISALVFISSIGVISASSLSLEGKSLWIVKTMPIDARTLLLSKMLPQFIISAPPLTVASVLLIISTKANFAYSIFIIIIPLLANMFFALLGTVINTALPKFDFRNEAEVIKQSLSVFIVMMAGMFVSFLSFGAAFLLTTVSHPLLSTGALALLFSALTILMYLILTRVSTKAYEKLDA